MKKKITEMQERLLASCKEFDFLNGMYQIQLEKFKKAKEKMENMVEAKSAYESVLNILNSSDNVKANEDNLGNRKQILNKMVRAVNENRSDDSDKSKTENLEEKTKIKRKLKKCIRELDKINRKILSYVSIITLINILYSIYN
jgi:hypothetical protein